VIFLKKLLVYTEYAGRLLEISPLHPISVAICHRVIAREANQACPVPNGIDVNFVFGMGLVIFVAPPNVADGCKKWGISPSMVCMPESIVSNTTQKLTSLVPRKFLLVQNQWKFRSNSSEIAKSSRNHH